MTIPQRQLMLQLVDWRLIIFEVEPGKVFDEENDWEVVVLDEDVVEDKRLLTVGVVSGEVLIDEGNRLLIVVASDVVDGDNWLLMVLFSEEVVKDNWLLILGVVDSSVLMIELELNGAHLQIVVS